MYRFAAIALVLLGLTNCGVPSYSLPKKKETKPRLFKRCGAYTLDECKQSLRTAVEVAARCSYLQQRQCLTTFVETLSAVDDKAPFYSSAFHGKFQLGDKKKYKKAYWKLSRDDRSAVKDLSALVGMQVKAYLESQGKLDKETAKELHNAVEMRFEMYANKLYKKAYASDLRAFTTKVRQFGNRIRWG